MKHHLARTQKDVIVSRSVAEEVKREMFEDVVGVQQRFMKNNNV